MLDVQSQITAFLAGRPHAVVGASAFRAKYGNKVLRAYLQNDRPVYAIHPTADEIEGLPCYVNLSALPERPHGISIITPPPVTEQIVQEAAALGIEHVWMQPGAESEAAVELAEQAGMNVLAGGPCVLVTLRFREG
ncbi:MAG: CoA-binding protein [Gemmatimonadales bacterium]